MVRTNCRNIDPGYCWDDITRAFRRSQTSLKGYSEYTTGKALAAPREFVMPPGFRNESEGVSRLALIADSLKRNPPPNDGPNQR